MRRTAILISTEQYVKLHNCYPIGKKVYDDNGFQSGIYDAAFHKANTRIMHGWMEGFFLEHTDGLWVEVEGVTGFYN